METFLRKRLFFAFSCTTGLCRRQIYFYFESDRQCLLGGVKTKRIEDASQKAGVTPIPDVPAE